MRKLVASTIATIIVVFGVAVTSVSAEQHKVEKGDNLWSIAEEYDTTVKALVEINELSTTVIQPKQLILINETYIVEEKDTLLHIAKKFDVEVKDIKEWNDLKSDIIVVGQELEIHGLHDEDEKGTNNTKKNATPKQETSNKGNEKEAAPEKATSNKDSKAASKTEGKTISVSATAYTAKCEGCSGITSTGVNLNNDPNAKVIAVDPSVIPLGSKVYVEGYGQAVAADVGGAIKGNKIDIHVPTKKEALNWGVRTVNVTVLD